MFIHFPQASEWLTGGVLWATPMIQVVGPNGKTHSFGVAMGSPTIEKHPCNCWWIYEWLWFMNCFQIGHRFRIFNGLVSGKIYRKPDQQWILVDFPFNKSTDSIPLNFPIYRWLSMVELGDSFRACCRALGRVLVSACGWSWYIHGILSDILDEWMDYVWYIPCHVFSHLWYDMLDRNCPVS